MQGKSNRRWTGEEIATINQLTGVYTDQQIAWKLGRTVVAVQSARRGWIQSKGGVR
jgi:hypothetical protein